MTVLNWILAQGWAFTVYCLAVALAVARFVYSTPRFLLRYRAYVVRCQERERRRSEDEIWERFRAAEAETAKQIARARDGALVIHLDLRV